MLLQCCSNEVLFLHVLKMQIPNIVIISHFYNVAIMNKSCVHVVTMLKVNINKQLHTWDKTYIKHVAAIGHIKCYMANEPRTSNAVLLRCKVSWYTGTYHVALLGVDLNYGTGVQYSILCQNYTKKCYKTKILSARIQLFLV